MIIKNISLAAIITALCLVGGMLLGIGVGNLLFETLPGHAIVRGTSSAIPTFAGIIGGGALWGRLMASIARSDAKKPMTRAGIFGFSIPVVVAIFVLIGIESAIAAAFPDFETAIPIHILFSILFVPTAIILASFGAYSLGKAMDDPNLAKRLALVAGLAGGAAFLVVNLIMDSLGWRVGAPGAAERFTMLTVLMVSSVGAALVGGGAVGYVLSQHREAVPHTQPELAT